jgi:uncharacterized protein (TIGR03067 family)
LIVAAVGCQPESQPQSAPSDWDDIGATADGKSIQGIWNQVSGGDPTAMGATWTFAGSEIEFRGASLAQDQAGLKGTFQLKSSVAPKQMNWKYPSLRESFVIYSLAGGTLKICGDENPTSSTDRPSFRRMDQSGSLS